MIESLRGALRRHGRVLAIAALALLVAAETAHVLDVERGVTGGEISLPLDDSFIYLQYAKALSEGHPFIYTPGNGPTTGATSLLYPLLLAPPHLLGLGPDAAIAWALLLGAAALVLSAMILARLAHRLGGVVASVVAVTLFLVSPYVLWGYLSGMEIGLYATVLLATVNAYLRERATGSFPRFQLWVFALAASRPEGAILSLVLGVLALWDRVRAARASAGSTPASPRPAPRSRFGAAAPFLAAALPFLLNLALTGSFEATSSQAKSILSEPYRESRETYLRETPGIVVTLAKAHLSLLELGANRSPVPAIAWTTGTGILLLGLLSLWPRATRSPDGRRILVLLGVGVALGALPVHWWVHLYRYLIGLSPLVIAAASGGWGRLAEIGAGLMPRALGVAARVILIAGALAGAVPPLWRAREPITRFYGHNCENIAHQQVAVGRWIDRNLPPDAIVGMNDAGAIAYYGKRSTVDFVGLTSAGYARVYRSGLGCLFEHVRREPDERRPTYFAVYPEWFPYWPASGLLGPEAYRAHLAFNTICGGTDKVVYPATWIDVAGADRPALDRPDLQGRALVDSLDLAWLEDERAHGWRAEPEAKDVLRSYAYADRSTRPLTDAGRIVRGAERFDLRVWPGREALLVMRTDAWYPSRLRVSVDGSSAGIWTIARSETAWVEPRFLIPGALLKRSRVEIRIERADAGVGQDYSPFHYWVYQ